MITSDLNVYIPLCQGCGSCAAACPYEALTLQRGAYSVVYPMIDAARCRKCMNCYRACPVKKDVVEKTSQSLAGAFLSSWVGYSTDEAVRMRGSSGGVVSTLIAWAIKERIVDGAVVVGCHTQDPFRSQGIIVTNEAEVSEASGSRYCPAALNTIFSSEKIHSLKRIAIVGLGCHIRGARNLAQVLGFREKIIFSIGLFCKQTKDVRYSEMIIKRMGLQKSHVQAFAYRKGSYPGVSEAVCFDGRVRQLPYTELSYVWSNFVFAPSGCFFCTDPVAEFADISVGDPWLPQFKEEKQGVSLLVARTAKGQDLVKRCEGAAALTLLPLPLHDVVRSQSLRGLAFKKEYFLEKIKLKSICDKTFPKKDFSCKQGVTVSKIITVVGVVISKKMLEGLARLRLFRMLPRVFHKCVAVLLKV